MIYSSATALYKPMPLHVTTLDDNNVSDMLLLGGTTGYAASTAWPSNNLALYVPIYPVSYFTVARFLVANGSNATGNVDVGLYDENGSLLLSTGSTARSGTQVAQYINVTNRTFPAGRYYLALVGSSTTGTYGVWASFTSAIVARCAGLMQEALGGTTLPSSMTPAAYAQTALFAYGFTQSDTL